MDPERIKELLWKEYQLTCQQADRNGRYDMVEPLAWRYMQQEKRKLKHTTKAAA